jgi:hypothetical protein
METEAALTSSLVYCLLPQTVGNCKRGHQSGQEIQLCIDRSTVESVQLIRPQSFRLLDDNVNLGKSVS